MISRNRWNVFVCGAAGLGAIFFGVAGSAAAQDASADAERARNKERLERFQEQEQAQEGKKAEWQKRYRDAIAAEREASARVEATEAAWSRGRNDNRLRGDAKVRAMDDLTQAKKDLAAARAELQAIPEQARLEGIPPGWLRDVEDSAAAPSLSGF